MEYYEKIRALREDNDLSQEELSKIFNISQQTLSQYETNRRSLPIEMLIKYVEFFNVSADYILGIDKKKKSKNNITFYNTNIRKIEIKWGL